MLYKVKTDLLSFAEKEEVIDDEIIRGKSYEDDSFKDIIERNPDWFEHVEEELQDGWNHVKPGYQKALVHTDGYGFGFDGEWTETFATSIMKKTRHTGRSNETRKATKDEIEQALIAEAKRRGFEVGVCIDSTNVGYPDQKKIKIDEDEIWSGFTYEEEIDELLLEGWAIYSLGKWAEIVDEPEPKTYEIESLNDILKIPSDRMPVFFKELSDSLINVRKNLERNGNEDLVNKVLVLEKTEWTDDGKEDKTFSISI